MAQMSERFDSLGDLLRAARERRGLTVQDLAAITRIPRRHLDALERDQLDELPGGMYRRAEVRTYAETVGLDKALALERLEQSLGPAADPVMPPPPVFDPSPRSRIYAVVITLGLIAAAGTTYWWWRQPALNADSTHAALATALVATSTAAAPAANAKAASRGASSTPRPPASRASALPAAPDAAAFTPANAATAETVAPAVNDLALTVTSSPSGARVLVDGIGYGATPITIRHLRPGQKRVRLVLDGYMSVEQPLRLSPARSATVDVTLDRSP
jgi:cytoskeleton protein RodZ